MARDLPIKTFAIILRGRFNREENDYEKLRVEAHSEDHACYLATLEGIARPTIAQAINIDTARYQRFVDSRCPPPKPLV